MRLLRLLLYLNLVLLLLPSCSNAFKFDIWSSNISLKEATKIAELHNKELQPSDIVGKLTTDSLGMKYLDTLMEYPAEIHLIFTPTPRRLCRIYISWNMLYTEPIIHKAKLSVLYSDLKTVFIQKYAKTDALFSHSAYENTSRCRVGVKSGFVFKLKIAAQSPNRS